ncbi:type IV pilus modification protein PilV [Acinetobacter courvalinii]|uniref:type IV pilus modification protein PilV n=1 Tax=Acinetobacter courvalinii TaxID=280147 RepID=UPI003A88995C
MQSYQRGVGLVEVLVALVLLAIVVLGFVALQIRAIAASHEAGRNIQAMNIARDLSERIRVNRDGLLDYKTIDSNQAVQDCASGSGLASFCNTKQMAQYDYKQISNKANEIGMQLAILDCQGSPTLKRKCIYVAWEGTTATNGTASTDCTNGAAYIPEAKCIIVEVYNYAE